MGGSGVWVGCVLERMFHAGLAVGSLMKVGAWADAWFGGPVNTEGRLVLRSDG